MVVVVVGGSIITAPPWTLLTSGATSCSLLSEEERRKAWPPHVSPWPRQKAALWLVFLPRLLLLPGGRVVSAFHKVRSPHASDPLAGVGVGASLTDALAASFLLQQWPKRGLGPGATGGLVGGSVQVRSPSPAKVESRRKRRRRGRLGGRLGTRQLWGLSGGR